MRPNLVAPSSCRIIRRGGGLLIAAIVTATCFCLDQISKSWALQHLSYAKYKPFIPGLLRLILVSNTGGAFGIACGNNAGLTVAALTVMAAIAAWVLQREKSGQHLNKVQWCGVGFLVGGAVGNLWDRLTLGHVTDFLDFAFINFPVFNLSDVFVDIGIGLVVLGGVFSSGKVFGK